MPASPYHRHNARSGRRLARSSRTPSIRPPSSHPYQRPSPGLSATATATPLWGPALWTNLLLAGGAKRRTPTPRFKSRAALPVSPSRSRLPRNRRNKTPACFHDDSHSRSEEELQEVTATKSQVSRSNTTNRYRRMVRSVSEEDNMLSTAKVMAPPTISVIPRKRSTQQPTDEDERAPKLQKTDPIDSIASAPKHGSSQTPILLDESDDDTPPAELWSWSRAPFVRVKEEAPPRKSFFSGLGVRGLGNSKSFSRKHAGAGTSAANAAEDVRVELSPNAAGTRPTRSASQNFSLYQKSVMDSERSATRIAELECELEHCKRDREAAIDVLKRDHEATLSRLSQDMGTTVDIMRLEHKSAARLYEVRIESERQNGEANLKSQAETQRLETKSLLDDIQRTATFQDDEKARRITALETEHQGLRDENQSLKGQLSAAKAALEEREVLIPSEDSFKALEARNLALTQELQVIKQHLDTPTGSQSQSQDIRPPTRPEHPLSPTPTLSSSFLASDETKTTNVRNMFLKVKRRHDNLVTVAKRIHDVTTGMDLAAFGEFGRQVGELKKVLHGALKEGAGGGVGGRQVSRGGDGEG
ncbi:hypothetical protein DPSP01_008192 [Paraphaeosphaeria sporulosa]